MEYEKKAGKDKKSASFRLNAKDRFILDYVAQISGMTITTVVERAIREYSKTIEDKAPSWKEFWDVSEGVRKISMLSCNEIETSAEDDELLDFVRHHARFFCLEGKEAGEGVLRKQHLDTVRVNVLWPKVEKYLSKWRDTRSTSPNEVGLQMESDLRMANVVPPS
jgi:hypothetical protein